jgi:hypothetical protein
MLTLSLTRLVIDGSLFCLTFGVVVMASLWWNARLWLQDYPKEIQAVVPPLNAQEKRTQKGMAVVILTIMIGSPALSLWLLRQDAGGQLTFISAFAHVWLLLQLANLFDAVVLDWLILVERTPKFAILPGTEHLLYLFADRRMHLRNFAKGVVIVSILSLPLALVASL